ncbi:MAG: cation:proton antiporter [Novosphingobium sp.]|jgi:CPA2 family monovalent cation:H+ antiporter-2
MAGPTELTSPAVADALVILGAAGLVIPVFARFRITPIIGFILVGLMLGPFGLGHLAQYAPWLDYLTISDPAVLTPFAEIGIILLLFSIGLELSFNRLWAMRRLVFGLGGLELVISALLVGSALVLLGNSGPTALALGLALALSSTALVLRITDSRTPVGRAALAMLLFEDIALIPIIFLLGALGRGGAAQDSAALVTTLWQGALVVAALLVLGRLLLPRLFAQAARTKSPELFLAATLLVVIGSALATAAVGLSPIVGALIAGLLIAETDYHAEVERITDPFKGLALGVFLITIGMSLDLAMIGQQWATIAIAVVSVLAIKAAVTAVLLRAMGARPGTATETGILMSSPSETTLIVLATASAVQLINAEAAQFWQTVTAIGLTITPALAWLGKRLGRRVDASRPVIDLTSDETPRAIVVGMGRVGRLVADMLARHDKPYVAIDGDPDIVSAASADGYPVLFGDAGWDQTLHRLGIEQAPAIILTMDEPVAVQRLVRKLRGLHPQLTIIARARDVGHAALLYRAGVSHAVPETLEASLQLSEAVLVDLGVPMGPVIASIHEKRDEFRQQIMDEGELEQAPSLRTGTLREYRGGESAKD